LDEIGQPGVCFHDDFPVHFFVQSHMTRFIAAVAIAVSAIAQVDAFQDQEWLRMWNEAQTHKPAQLSGTGRIAAEGEPGTPMAIHGRILQPDGKSPTANVIVFAYQTDAEGVYSGPGKPGRPWRLQGWAVTGADGRFEFRSVRPAPYPGRSIPAHVHLSLQTQSYGRQWTEELRFSDDKFVTADERKKSEALGLYRNVVTPTIRDGVQHVDFTVRLKPRGDF
jgi:protocatechuate 3,4-dioxygenase beta subunit